jgi:hypothetical protein
VRQIYAILKRVALCRRIDENLERLWKRHRKPL